MRNGVIRKKPKRNVWGDKEAREVSRGQNMEDPEAMLRSSALI